MGPENEYSPEVRETEDGESYSNCVILGSGFRSDKPGSLTLESKIRTLAAGVLAEEGDIKKLIFSGGITQGGSPSEASAMRDYLLEKYPDLTDFPIELEEESVDTQENARNIAAKLQERGGENTLVLTNESHLPRSLETFSRNGMIAEGLSAESLLSERSSAHHELMDGYRKSFRNRKNQAIEIILRGISRSEHGRDLLNQLAHHSRG